MSERIEAYFVWRDRSGNFVGDGGLFCSRGGCPGEVGHAFNAVVNKRGVVKFIDGQTGKAADVAKYRYFRYLFTN